MYLTKTPEIIKPIAKDLLWNKARGERKIYLTFDDGPHPEITRKVMDILDVYVAKATFFCVGENVEKHPEICEELISRGHRLGGHTFDHSNGWKSSWTAYMRSYLKGQDMVKSDLFRPPYGRITSLQAKSIKRKSTIVMW
ncbi:MAG: polysaccharide deacetylase family protein, partial [Bacteroidota bacterium]